VLVAPLTASGQGRIRTLAATAAPVRSPRHERRERRRYANLAGQPQDYLARQLRDFRDGKRPATIMHRSRRASPRPDRGRAGVLVGGCGYETDMARLHRRAFLKAIGAGTATTAAPAILTACATAPAEAPKPIGRVIVIGGGYGGATCAKYIRMWSERRI
jgi:hypothetical protein